MVHLGSQRLRQGLSKNRCAVFHSLLGLAPRQGAARVFFFWFPRTALLLERTYSEPVAASRPMSKCNDKVVLMCDRLRVLHALARWNLRGLRSVCASLLFAHLLTSLSKEAVKVIGAFVNLCFMQFDLYNVIHLCSGSAHVSSKSHLCVWLKTLRGHCKWQNNTDPNP